MAGKLGQFFIEYRATADKYLGDLKKMAKDSKEFEKALAPLKKSITEIGLGMTAVGGAVTTAFLAMAKQAANYGDAIRDASIRTGVSTEKLSGLKFAAEQTGTSFEAINTGLTRLSRSTLAAAQGTKASEQAFKSLGIAVKDAGGHLRSQDDLIGDVADRFSKLKDGTEKAALAQQLFGRGGTQMIEFLNQGKEGLAAFQKQAEDMGLVLGTDAVNAADEFNDSLNALSNAQLGLSNTISQSLLPTFTKLINFTTGLVIEFRKFTAIHPELITNIAKLSGVILGTGGLLIGLAGVLTILPKIEAALAFLLTPLGLVTAAITGLVAAFVLFPQFRSFVIDVLRDATAAFAFLGVVAIDTGKALVDIALGRPLAALKDFTGSWDRGMTAAADATNTFNDALSKIKGALEFKAPIIPPTPKFEAPPVFDDSNASKFKQALDRATAQRDSVIRGYLDDLEGLGRRWIDVMSDAYSKDLGAFIKSRQTIIDIQNKNRGQLAEGLEKQVDQNRKWIDVMSDDYSKSLGKEIEAHDKAIDEIDKRNKEAAEKWQRAWATAIGNISSQFASGVLKAFGGDSRGQQQTLQKQITDLQRQGERDRLQNIIDFTKQGTSARKAAEKDFAAFNEQIRIAENSERDKQIGVLQQQLAHEKNLFAKFADGVEGIFAELGKSILKIMITNVFQKIAKSALDLLGGLGGPLGKLGGLLGGTAKVASTGVPALAGLIGEAPMAIGGLAPGAAKLGGLAGSSTSLTGSLISGGLAAAGSIVGALITKGNAKRTEENTRESRDWLELMANAWNPLFNQMVYYQKGVYEFFRGTGGPVSGNGRLGPGTVTPAGVAAAGTITINAPFSFAPNLTFEVDGAELNDLEVREIMAKITRVLDSGVRGYREKWAQLLALDEGLTGTAAASVT